MEACHLSHPGGDLPDMRMAAYFEGEHHPRQALPGRIGYVAMAADRVIGYIAGHRTTRNRCDGEVQYLYVALEHRRRGVATALLRLLADWFTAEGVRKVCVPLAADSPPEAKPFFESAGASPLRKFWYGWDDISLLRR
jgi:GNAT superfamily N-acetyltransferase